MKVLLGHLLCDRPIFIMALVLAMGLAACGKEEVMAPAGQASGILKGGELSGGDQGFGDGAMINGAVETGKGSDDHPSSTIRGFDGEEPIDDSISDDGDDEGDNEKSKTKPGTN